MKLLCLKVKFKTFLDDESGATALEYALLVGILSVGLTAALTAMGTGVNNNFELLANTIDPQDTN